MWLEKSQGWCREVVSLFRQRAVMVAQTRMGAVVVERRGWKGVPFGR